MLKIFRRFRQRLLSENKFSKYLLYSVGEIVLVVIGILIALQFNAWNEYQKDRATEKRLINFFLRDFNKDSITLKSHIKREETVFKYTDSTIMLMAKGDSKDFPEFLRLAASIGFLTDFKSSSGTFDEALSNGDMELILNDSLRENIFTYYRSVRGSNDNSLGIEFVTKEIVPSYFRTLGASAQLIKALGISSYTGPELTFEQVNANPEFNRILAWRRINSRFLIDHWNDNLKEISKIKSQLSRELNQSR